MCPDCLKDVVSPAVFPTQPTVGEDRWLRAEAMLLALKDALDKVYDADGEQQLHKLAHDYCLMVEDTPCRRSLCSPSHPHQDCPLLKSAARSNATSGFMPPL